MYKAPINDIGFCVEAVAMLDELRKTNSSDSMAPDIIAAALTAGAKFTDSQIATLDEESDKIGAQFENGKVILPPGFVETYRKWREAGWMAADVPAEQGGGGLPLAVGAALNEMWHSGCMGFAMGLVLTRGAIELIENYGDAKLRDIYLPKLVSGEWTATMAMTEPQAGSDLSLVQTFASQSPDGSWRVSGDKIFISYGEHDAADNILHLVLARTGNSQLGTKGLSLFLVPKHIYGTDGPAARNAVECIGIERKLGLHGSPTCSMRFGDDEEGALGWLIGKQGGGLVAMFDMMNHARLSTGMQGAAIAEAAYQQAQSFASDRIQGKSIAGDPVTIDQHPDVRRMLLDMRSSVFAGRCLSLYAAGVLDLAAHSTQPKTRKLLADRGALLTPIVKAYASELGVEVASTAIQIHGGMGFIEETGVAQKLRDIRIAPIYEGTNGLQAIDLVQRKIQRDAGEAAYSLIEQLSSEASSVIDEELAIARESVLSSLTIARRAVDWLIESGEIEDKLWGASSMLKLLGQCIAATTLLRAANISSAGSFSRPTDMKLLAVHFATSRLSYTDGLFANVTSGETLRKMGCPTH